MSLAHTPLEELSDAVRRILAAPPAMKAMAAKGMAPLPPRDLLAALYSLALDADATLANLAKESAAKLPDKLLGGLGDAGSDPRVLDFFARKVATRRPLVEALITNRATAGDTVAELARLATDVVLLDLIAENETRLLAAPAIIAAMYMNPKARMLTVTRAVELAARNDVKVDIPGWDDVVAEIGKAAPVDAEVLDVSFARASEDAVGDTAIAQAAAEAAKAAAEAAAKADELPEDLLNQPEAKEGDPEQKSRIQDLPVGAKMRLAMLGNAFARSVLIRDSNRVVALAAVRSPRITDSEIVSISANRAVSDDVIRHISGAKEWLRLYQVKVNLIQNPKCPLAVSMRMLPHLDPKKLKVVAKSKNIPSALVAQAKKLIAVKKPPGGPG